MGAPKGNKYYLLAKEALGRRLIFKTAEEFTEQFLEYVQYIEENPIMTKKASQREYSKPVAGEDSDEATSYKETRQEAEPKRRPLSIYGMCAYLGVSPKWFTNCISNLEKKGDDASEDEKDLLTALVRARTLIEMHQYEGGVIGDFNANMVIRALGLGEKLDMTSDGNAIAASIPTINIYRDNREAGGH